MKYLKQSLGLVLFLFLAAHLSAKDVGVPENNAMKQVLSAMPGDTAVTFTVYGNCGMCKERIEGAVKNEKGVFASDWSEDTKLLTVRYDNKVISLEDIQKRVAAVGHDTDAYRADKNVYKKLHKCCQYERPKDE